MGSIEVSSLESVSSIRASKKGTLEFKKVPQNDLWVANPKLKVSTNNFFDTAPLLVRLLLLIKRSHPNQKGWFYLADDLD